MAVEKRIIEGTVAKPAGMPVVIGLARRFMGVSLYRNSLYLILNAIVPAVTGFLFWTVAARLYSAQEIGTASATLSIMTLLMFLSTLGLEFGLVRFLPDAGETAMTTVISCFAVSALGALALSAVFLLGIPVWSPALAGLRDSPFITVAFICFTAVFSLYSLAHHLFVASRRAGYALTQTAVFSLARFLPLFLLAGLFSTSGVFTAWGIATTLALGVSLVFLIPRLGLPRFQSPVVNLPVVRRMLKFSLANFSANFLWMMPGLVLPLMVANVLGTQANAYFAIGWAVASIILMIPMGVSLALFAEGSHDSRNLQDDLHRSALLTVMLVAPAIVIAWTAGEWLLGIFGREYAENAIQLLRLLAISALPASVNYLYVSLGRVRKRMAGVIGLSGFISLATLVLSYFLLPRYGIQGAGIAFLLGQTLPFPLVTALLIRNEGRSQQDASEYGTFIDGSKVSAADYALHLGRYRFAGQLTPGKKCLDIGCGTGYGSDYLARSASTVIAGDKSPGAIHLARRNAAGTSLHLFDATALPFANDSFDTVTAFEVIEHISSYEKLVAEAHRVLRRDGVLVLSTPNRLAGPLFFSTSWDHHVHEFSPGELERLVNRWFGTCEVYGQDFVDGRQLGLRRLRQTAGRVLEKLHLRPLGMWLGRLIFIHNRLVTFHRNDFILPQPAVGAVRPCHNAATPTTLVIVARKR